MLSLDFSFEPCSNFLKSYLPPTGLKYYVLVYSLLGGLELSRKMLAGSVAIFAEEKEVSVSFTT